MSNVDNAIEQMISAITSSEEYRTYAQLLGKVKEQPLLKQQLDDYRARCFTLQGSDDYDLEKIETFEKEFGDFCAEPLVAEFLEAEVAFCRMMQEIDKKVTEALNFE